MNTFGQVVCSPLPKREEGRDCRPQSRSDFNKPVRNVGVRAQQGRGAEKENP